MLQGDFRMACARSDVNEPSLMIKPGFGELPRRQVECIGRDNDLDYWVWRSIP
jgi:hypothetical protein